MAKIQELYDRASGETIYPVSTTRAVICPNGSDLETRLTSEKQSIESRLEKAKFALFVDLWNEAWGEYGGYDPDNAPAPEHPFMGNRLWFTYDEAVEIYQRSYTQNLWSLERVYKGCRLPTVLPLRVPTHELKGTGVFESAVDVTRISIIGPPYDTTINLSEASSMFANCSSLEEVVCSTHILRAAYHNVPPTNIFYNCFKLKEIRFYCEKVGFDIHWSPLLSLASVQSFIPPKAVPDGATITVHPDVYAKLTDETNTEWHALLALAAEKNITFATT